jgi:hypothetical protein
MCLEKPIILTIIGLNKLTTPTLRYILVVSKCMLGEIRPSFEVVNEGRILDFLSGYRKF